MCCFRGHCCLSGLSALWNWCYVKPGLRWRIYFFCILNFLSSCTGMCECGPRTSTDRFVKRAECPCPQFRCWWVGWTKRDKTGRDQKWKRAVIQSTDHACGFRRCQTAQRSVNIYTLTGTVSSLKSKLKYTPRQELLLISDVKYQDSHWVMRMSK